MRIFLAFLIVLFAAASPQARAHYNVYPDGDYGFKLSFPDTWKMQGGLPGDARIKLLAPGNDGAQCTIFAKKDRRFMIYPHDYMVDVVAQEIQWNYWEQAVANYDDLYFYYDNYGALGGGDARYTLVDYIDRTTTPAIRKRAWVHATLYGDLHMMTHCSAPIEQFNKYATDFGQIVDSITMRPQYATTYRGDYRDFLETKQYAYHWYEPIVLFFRPTEGLAAALHCTFSGNSETCSSKPKPRPILTR